MDRRGYIASKIKKGRNSGKLTKIPDFWCLSITDAMYGKSIFFLNFFRLVFERETQFPLCIF